MKMNSAVFDTNILMDYAAGVKKATDVVRHCQTRVICTLTYMELMVAIPEQRFTKMKEFLVQNFEIEPLDQRAIENAVHYKNHYRMNMPDALIYGFARSRGLILVTRNTRDFNPHWGQIKVPYEL